MARKKFRTPPALPEDTQCRGTVVPASREWLGLYSDALLELTYAYNYEQVEPTDLTPDETAQAAYQQYLAWLDSTCGGGSAIPTLPDLDTPIYRRNPTTGRWEYLNNGAWVEPTGEDAIPEPAPREEPTEPEQKCGAASNAAYALRELYSAILSAYDETLAPAVNQANIAFQVAVAIGASFGPVSAAFLALSDFAWTVFTQALAEITEDDWSNEFQALLVCILEKASTVTDGVVTFDFFTVNSELVGFVLPVIDDFVRVRWQVWYLLQMIGEQGLNDAGGATAVEGDCVTCDTWCVTLTPSDFGFAPANGETFIDSNGWLTTPGGGFRQAYGTLAVDTSQCIIKRVGFVVVGNGASTATLQVQALPSDGPVVGTWYSQGMTGFPIGRTSNDNSAWGTNSDATTVHVYMSNDNYGYAPQIRQVYIYGTGRNPFGVGSNC